MSEEELVAGAQHRLPRVVVGLVLAALVVVGLVVAVAQHDPGPSPRPSDAPTTAAAPRVDALAASARRGVFLRMSAGRIIESTPSGRTLARGGVSQASPTAYGRVQLLVDDAAGLVWVVPRSDTTPGRVESYSLDDLALRRRVPLPGPLRGVAALDGALFAATDTGLQVLRRGARSFADLGRPLALDLVADPTRHRLLLVLVDGGFQLAAYTEARGVFVRAERMARYALAPVVVGGVIWSDDSRGSTVGVVALDPDTLRAETDTRRVLPRDAANITGVGDRSLFVRSQTRRGYYCLDARTGAVRGFVTGAADQFAVTRGRAYTAGTLGPARPVPLGRCPG